MLGFAPFNRPVAKIFLGDVGSLPIGLLLGWCLLQLAYHQQFAAALLLPLYYLVGRHRDACCAGSSGASRSGRRIARISISARPTMALRYGRWWAKCSRSISGLRRWRPDRSWRHRLRSSCLSRHRRHRRGRAVAPVRAAALSDLIAQDLFSLAQQLLHQFGIARHRVRKIVAPRDRDGAFGLVTDPRTGMRDVSFAPVPPDCRARPPSQDRAR